MARARRATQEGEGASEREGEQVNNHKHNFMCSDIPGVFLCKCGVEQYYSRELQDYVVVEGER